MNVAALLLDSAMGAGPDARTSYRLPLAEAACRRLAAGWLWVSFLALVGAGIFALLVGLARTPYLSSLFPTVDFYRSALVVHVDLSVLFWFFAFAGVLWSVASPPRLMVMGWLGLWFASLGALLVVASPFIDSGGPMTNNYIPILHNRTFLLGLFAFGAGVGLAALRAILTTPGIWKIAATPQEAVNFGLHVSGLATVVALAAIAWSYASIPYFVRGLPYYESLFWGGGHVLQFACTLMMLAGWLWLAGECGTRIPITPRLTALFFALGVAPVLATPFIYAIHPVHTQANMAMFTTMMRAGSGVAVLPIGLAVAIALWRQAGPARDAAPLHAALLCSILLFTFGGSISFLITRNSTVMTAHYHATGGAVSIAFMGLAYALLPRIGFAPARSRIARWQAYVYGSGQFLHILGLLWSGGYGAQRKLAGAEQGLHGFGQVAGMGLMGLGGLVAVVGGIMFLVAVYPPLRAGAHRGAGSGSADV